MANYMTKNNITGPRRGPKGKKRRSVKDYMSKAAQAAYVADKALRVARSVKFLVNAERKATDFDMDLSGTSIDNTGASLHCTPVAQGSTFSERNGRTIRVTDIRIHGNVHAHASATETRVRFMLVQDRQNGGAGNASASAFMRVSGWIDDIREADPTAMKRYNILYDRTLIMDSNHIEDGTIDIHKKVNIKVRYIDATAASAANNRLAWYAISNQATNAPSCTMIGRIWFYDN